jgi:hypothetical protein
VSTNWRHVFTTIKGHNIIEFQTFFPLMPVVNAKVEVINVKGIVIKFGKMGRGELIQAEEWHYGAYVYQSRTSLTVSE